MMGLAGLLGTVELKSRGSVCLWPLVPPEDPSRRRLRGDVRAGPGLGGPGPLDL